MKLDIRHAEEKDATAIHAMLISPHVVEGTMRLPVAPVSQTLTRIAPEAGIYKLVAVTDADVVGFCELITHPLVPRHAHAGEINMIVTRADKRRQGVARGLMTYMVSLADNWLGLQRLELTVWARNEHAIRLYRSLGFAEEGLRRSYVLWRGELLDAVIMGRVVSAGQSVAPAEGRAPGLRT